MMTAPPPRPSARATQLAALATPLRATAVVLSIVAVLFQPHDADAATVPQFLPNRDVEVQYTVTAPGQPPHEYGLSFSAKSERARIDDVARGIWFLVDLRDASAALVVPQLRAVVTDTDLANLAAILQSVGAARFTPLGEATIAGLRCTRYLVLSEKATGTTCLTANGIALAVSGQDSRGSARVVADSVSEAMVPPDSLTPPPDFSVITLPRGVVAALLGN